MVIAFLILCKKTFYNPTLKGRKLCFRGEKKFLAVPVSHGLRMSTYHMFEPFLQRLDGFILKDKFQRKFKTNITLQGWNKSWIQVGG